MKPDGTRPLWTYQLLLFLVLGALFAGAILLTPLQELSYVPFRLNSLSGEEIAEVKRSYMVFNAFGCLLFFLCWIGLSARIEKHVYGESLLFPPRGQWVGVGTVLLAVWLIFGQSVTNIVYNYFLRPLIQSGVTNTLDPVYIAFSNTAMNKADILCDGISWPVIVLGLVAQDILWRIKKHPSHSGE